MDCRHCLGGSESLRPSKMSNCRPSLRPPVRPKIDDDWISMDDVFDDDWIAMDDRLGPPIRIWISMDDVTSLDDPVSSLMDY